MPKRADPNPEKGHVKGLAVALADRAPIRELFCRQKTLLCWPAPTRTGVVCAQSVALNKAVMMEVAAILGPQGKHPMGLCVPTLFAEASQVDFTFHQSPKTHALQTV